MIKLVSIIFNIKLIQYDPSILAKKDDILIFTVLNRSKP